MSPANFTSNRPHGLRPISPFVLAGDNREFSPPCISESIQLFLCQLFHLFHPQESFPQEPGISFPAPALPGKVPDTGPWERRARARYPAPTASGATAAREHASTEAVPGRNFSRWKHETPNRATSLLARCSHSKRAEAARVTMRRRGELSLANGLLHVEARDLAKP